MKLALIICSIVAPVSHAAQRTRTYFPSEVEWESVEPAKESWDADKLQATLKYAEKAGSSGVVVLLNGRILAEGHWQPVSPSFRYRNMTHGRTSAGHHIEDVASCQKSVVSVLVGIAQEKKLLGLDDPVHKHLGRGWSKATRQQEARITIRHLLTMTSGLTEQLTYDAPVGTKWKYNTTAYSHTLAAICKATGKDPNEVTKEWLTDPLGMKDSKWVPRGKSGANKFGFATTARDLARFGLMVQSGGNWGKRVVLADKRYLRESLSSSQKLNRAYGYLWWVNRKRTSRSAVRLIPSAPRDLVGAFGTLGRRCYVVPSQRLVVTRLGDEPKNKQRFQTEFWRLLAKAAPTKRK